MTKNKFSKNSKIEKNQGKVMSRQRRIQLATSVLLNALVSLDKGRELSDSGMAFVEDVLRSFIKHYSISSSFNWAKADCVFKLGRAYSLEAGRMRESAVKNVIAYVDELKINSAPISDEDRFWLLAANPLSGHGKRGGLRLAVVRIEHLLEKYSAKTFERDCKRYVDFDDINDLFARPLDLLDVTTQTLKSIFKMPTDMREQIKSMALSDRSWERWKDLKVPVNDGEAVRTELRRISVMEEIYSK